LYWDRFDVLGVDDQHRERAFQQVVHRLPEYASNNVANRVLEWTFSIDIPRARVRGGPIGTDTAGSPQGAAGE
jgi:hypothetical protein